MWEHPTCCADVTVPPVPCRLLDLGFEDDISEIMERLNVSSRDAAVTAPLPGQPQRQQQQAQGAQRDRRGTRTAGSRKLQTLLLSATLNMRVQRLASRSLRRPVRVTVRGESVEVSEGEGDAAPGEASAGAGGEAALRGGKEGEGSRKGKSGEVGNQSVGSNEPKGVGGREAGMDKSIRPCACATCTSRHRHAHKSALHTRVHCTHI